MEEKNEWIWYKNLVLPTIAVQLESSPETQSSELHLTLDVVCFKCNYDKSFEPIHLLGQTSYTVKTEKIMINGLKFQETTFLSKVTICLNTGASLSSPAAQIMGQAPSRAPSIFLRSAPSRSA